MSEHTNGQWRVQHPHAGDRGWEVADSSGLNQICQDATEANARRIVACVNACHGLDTTHLEQTGLVSAVGYQLIELTKQRDQLLAALESARAFIGEQQVRTETVGKRVYLREDVGKVVRVMGAIDAAIAAAKGGAV